MRVEVDARQLVRRLEALEKRHLPFALSQALNRTAEEAQRAATSGLRVFDNPVPLTTRSVFVKRVTKQQVVANGGAEVFLRNEASKGTPPSKYLEPEVRGGPRRVKRFERALRFAGVMGPNEWAMPGPGAKLDRFGNVSSGTITSVLSQMRASPDPLQNVTVKSKARLRRKGKQLYFTPRPGSALKAGIYARTGPRPVSGGDPRGAIPVLAFVHAAPAYRPRYNFFLIVNKVHQRRFEAIFRDQLRRAMATDRGR